MTILQTANLALRFILELCTLAAIGYWGFRAGEGILGKLGLGIGLPLLAAAVWAIFGAPDSAVTLPILLHGLLELLLFGAAALALYASRKPGWAIAFGVVLAINRLLMYIWNQ
ncbi:YrdB family protein [Paenibacillus hamazuiensis]|uniref:YrdB family protein n=1 Tax=Paenibacillus hamazuiensis TaxID=2936508 RepID=UPI00200C3699|nr:YrdB family protein [Paenibacillus hamazuiensis]